MIPQGTTHFSIGYGDEISFFKKEEYDHLNQLCEEWQIWVNWYWWWRGKWEIQGPGSGFSPRRCKPIVELDDDRSQ